MAKIAMEYELIRSDRKTLALEITRDLRTVVRAPKRAAKRDIDRFVESHAEWIRLHMERQRTRAESNPEPTADEQLRLISLAGSLLPQRVAYYSDIMGLKPTGITITGAVTRFGSCSVKNRLCFSWRLMSFPNEAIDYVVVHELAHIAEKNHGKAFYALIENVLPDYRERIKTLKK